MDADRALGESESEGVDARDAAARSEAGFRYGAVFILTLVMVVVLIGIPAADWSRALAIALEFTSLLVVVVTSRERKEVRRIRAFVLGGAAFVAVVLVCVGAMPAVLTFTIAGGLSILIPANLLGGLIRLVRKRGITQQVVAGALAIYLLLGVTFAFVISIVARVGDQPYFAHGSDGSLSDRVYYSFSVLTTTGFGDFTAGHPFGRSLAVVEMLMGQLYIATVIGVLVGDIASRRRGAQS